MVSKKTVAALLASLFLFAGIVFYAVDPLGWRAEDKVADDALSVRDSNEATIRPREPEPVAPAAPAVAREAKPTSPPPAAAEPRDGGALFEGRVTDTEERQVPEAVVRLVPFASHAAQGAPDRRLDVEDSGWFRAEGLPAGSYQLRVSAPGYWPANETVLLPRDEPAHVRLKPATYIRGHAFLRDRSQPLRNATLSLLRRLPTGYAGDAITTNDEGEFVSYPLVSGDHVLTLKYESFKPVTLSLQLTEERPAEGLEVVFVDGHLVRGTIRNREGTPLSWAELYYAMSDAPPSHRLGSSADGEGRFELKGLDAGRARVTLSRVAGPGLEQEIEVGSHESEVVLVFDVPPPTLVQVRSLRDEPLPGETLTYELRDSATSGGPRTAGTLRTHEDGDTALVGLPRRGHLTLITGRREVGSARLVIELPAPTDPIVLHLEPWGSVVGKVIDREGRPVAGAGVRAGTLHRTTTDDDGRFELELPGGEWDLEASSKRLGRTVEEVLVEADTRTAPVTLVLGANSGQAIRGRVVTPGGKPIPGVDVRIAAVAVTGHDVTRVETDAAGWFTASLPPGSYAIRLQHPDYLRREPVPPVRPGAPPLELLMHPRPERVIAGRVLHEGVAVEGATVRLFVLPQAKFRFPLAAWGAVNATDRHGRFVISAIDPSHERGIVVAHSSHFAFARSEEFEIPPQGRVDSIEVLSVPGIDLELRAVGPDGKPVARAVVRLESADQPPLDLRGATDSSGEWRVPRLPPGDYHVFVLSLRPKLLVRKTLSWGTSSDPVTVHLLPVPTKRGHRQP